MANLSAKTHGGKGTKPVNSSGPPSKLAPNHQHRASAYLAVQSERLLQDQCIAMSVRFKIEGRGEVWPGPNCPDP